MEPLERELASGVRPFINELPSEDDLFKVIMLTSEIVWKRKIFKRDVDKWLSNFTGKVFDIAYERQLALWLLSNFVYYNEDEVRHLCRILYRDFLHHMVADLDTTIESEIEALLSSSRFYYLGKPGESGSFILYYFRQENNLPIDNFISSPEKLPNHIKTIVFVDDVTLSGTQAGKYIKGETRSIDETKKTVLLTFFSTNDAEALLRSNNIQVISCIALDERCKCFSNSSSAFHHCQNHLDTSKEFARAYGKELVPFHPLGYKNGEYAFGFFYNTPDNTLPIFWAEYGGWTPILKRYGKKYSGGIYDEFGRFV